MATSAGQQNTGWDIVTGVGITALVVAAARAIESGRPDALIDDPLAVHFAGTAPAHVAMPTTLAEAARGGAESLAVWDHQASQLGVRTRRFDRFLQQAGEDGVTQAVILAAGLDVRAHRLDWPSGFRLFEIDQPRVLAFKDQVLAQHGAHPRCTRHPVAADLRADWPVPLVEAGFDPALPTVWLAEGLLGYLSREAEEQLIDNVHELSAPGSRIALEHLRGIPQLTLESEFRRVSLFFDVDLHELMHDEDDRRDPDITFAAHGWQVSEEHPERVAEQYGRKLDPISKAMAHHNRFVFAALG
ncbi:SAM-dependent methyltransferase [Saccharopolyspora taberi]|uniref:S-adenosyl-L-methionine-dependent methyltransferase n=1 Tax=Saccharopolyspora taberi TaxID=60895 RepID=A0ABN3V3P8_9PSEU